MSDEKDIDETDIDPNVFSTWGIPKEQTRKSVNVQRSINNLSDGVKQSHESFESIAERLHLSLAPKDVDSYQIKSFGVQGENYPLSVATLTKLIVELGETKKLPEDDNRELVICLLAISMELYKMHILKDQVSNNG